MKKSVTDNFSKYYSRLESRIGYWLVMKRSQHFGYYDKNHRNEKQAQDRYHEKFLELLDVKSGTKILDAGCGQGVVATYIASATDAMVQGITITPIEVKTARHYALQHGVAGQTSFSLQDYASTDFDDNTFDRVYTTESLSHAVDVSIVTNELNRILKPGGKLVCAEYEMDYKNFSSHTKKLAELIRTEAGINAVYQFGPGEFEKNLKAVGLKISRIENWTTSVKPSFDRLRRLAAPFLPVVKILGLERRFINIVAASMYADGVEDGIFAYKVYVCSKPK